MEDIFWHAAGPLISDDEPSAVLLAGMMVLAADGMLVNLADTEANREGVRLDRDRGRFVPVSAAAGGRPHRPRGPRQGRGDPGLLPGRGADSAKRLARRRSPFAYSKHA